jgi:hypothetical protein
MFLRCASRCPNVAHETFTEGMQEIDGTSVMEDKGTRVRSCDVRQKDEVHVMMQKRPGLL